MPAAVANLRQASSRSGNGAYQRMMRPRIVGHLTGSATEGMVEEGDEEVLSLTQRLPLRRTDALRSLNQGGELLL